MASRLTASLLSSAMLATTAVAAFTATPALAAGVATAGPVRHVLPTTERALDVLAVGSDVWVAAGNSVLITTPAGVVKKTVTGLFGAKALTLSPDRASVYVSANTGGRIFQVSASGVVLGSWTSQACPGKSAIAGGALYYVYGCSAADAGVARFDLTTRTDASVLKDSSAEALTAAGSTVVTYSGGGFTSYRTGGDGSLSKLANAHVSTVYDVEISPDGSHIAATNYGGFGYGVARYATATMTMDGSFPTGPYPDAVAWSPDGSKIAGVLNAHYDELPVQVFSATDGSTLMKATKAGYTSYQSQAHEASWSADGKYIYSLAQEYTGKPTLVVTPAAGQKRAALAVSVTKAKTYGKNLKITVRAANRPNLKVALTVTQNGAATTRTVTTNSSGTATLTLPAKANGKVTASTPTDLTYLSSTGSAAFTTPAVVTAKLAGYGSVSKGVAQYSSVSKVRVDLRLLPKHTGQVAVKLQYRDGKSWKTGLTTTFTTEHDGTLPVVMTKGAKKVTYRFVVQAKGDSVAAGSPSVTSQSFIVR
jgi:Tol biopolymer transport system component